MESANTPVWATTIDDSRWPQGIKVVGLEDPQGVTSCHVEFAHPRDKVALQNTLSAAQSTHTSHLDAQTLPSSPDNSNIPVGGPAIAGEDDILSTEATSSNQQQRSGVVHDSVYAQESSPNWRLISFEDPDFKFQVMKRVMQRTGVLLSDPFIQRCSTVGTLYDELVTAPKAKKLADQIDTDSRLTELGQLSNVKLLARRQTPIDKEKEVGRWKVIEEELVARGLPVTGHMAW